MTVAAKERWHGNMGGQYVSCQTSQLQQEKLEIDAVLAGRWTVDMFAMFHLGRPDVFPLGDLAVRKGLQELYKLKVHLCLLHLLQVQIGQVATDV
jgi:DNA-3-methyladenine glycosylase II